MNGLTIICAKGGKLLYHKAFQKGWGVQEEFIDPLILGGVFYTLWCNSIDLYVRGDVEKSLDLVFPEKQTRLHFTESNNVIWVLSMKSTVSSKTAKNVLHQAMKNWESIKDCGKDGISEGMLARPEISQIKHNFMDILRSCGEDMLIDIFNQDGAMQCLVVWGPPFFCGAFGDLIALPVKRSIFNCMACMKIKEEPMPKYKSVYLDSQCTPTVNGQSKLRGLIEQRIMPTLDFEQLGVYSKDPGCHHTSQADLSHGKKTNKKIWYIVMGDLLVFVALEECRDINCLLSKNWSNIQELEAIMKFTMKRSKRTKV